MDRGRRQINAALADASDILSRLDDPDDAQYVTGRTEAAVRAQCAALNRIRRTVPNPLRASLRLAGRVRKMPSGCKGCGSACFVDGCAVCRGDVLCRECEQRRIG